MKERIRQIMEAQHMNQQAFAKFTHIGSASLSSIFTGRTRPTMNHVLAIMEAFPNVNPTWLLKGEGGMLLTNDKTEVQNGENSTSYNDAEEGRSASVSQYGNPYYSETENKNSSTDNVADGLPLFGQRKQVQIHPSVLPPVEKSPSGRYSKLNQVGVTQSLDALGHRKITEIRVFFDDQTWESFVPKNK
ncbi:MAG: helix-turn-helix transcriptional regulator [Prevotella sp.]|nr:helix-turn-helix transcriptional regulator [Prevotella sp.]